MATRWSAIDAREVPHTRRETFSDTGRFTPTVRLECAWNDRFPLIQDLYTCSLGPNLSNDTVGYHPRSWPNTTVGGPIGSPPMTRATMDSVGVVSATVVPLSDEAYNVLADSDDMIAAPKSTAYVDVRYGAYFNIEDTLSFDTEVITQSYRDFAWLSKATTSDLRYVKELEIPVVTLHQMVLTRTFMGLSRGNLGLGTLPDLASLSICLNHTNSIEYFSIHLGKTFKIGTLLMLEPEVLESSDMQTLDKGGGNAFGKDGHSVKVRFLYKPGEEGFDDRQQAKDENTHNLFYRPRIVRSEGGITGGWDRLIIAEEKVGKTEWKPYNPFTQEPLIDTNWLMPSELPKLAT